MKPFHAGFAHIVFGIVTEHCYHCGIGRGFTFPICAVKAVGFGFKMQMFHRLLLINHIELVVANANKSIAQGEGNVKDVRKRLGWERIQCFFGG